MRAPIFFLSILWIQALWGAAGTPGGYPRPTFGEAWEDLAGSPALGWDGRGRETLERAAAGARTQAGRQILRGGNPAALRPKIRELLAASLRAWNYRSETFPGEGPDAHPEILAEGPEGVFFLTLDLRRAEGQAGPRPALRVLEDGEGTRPAGFHLLVVVELRASLERPGQWEWMETRWVDLSAAPVERELILRPWPEGTPAGGSGEPSGSAEPPESSGADQGAAEGPSEAAAREVSAASRE